jgi:hypothetical protein
MKKLIFIASALVFGLTFNSCDDDNDSDSRSYSYKVRMTDAPAAYDEVNIDLQAVEVTGTNGQTVLLNTTAGMYNLLDYSNGTNTLIATSTLTDANVEQIRLILGSNNTITVDGTTYPLSTPSAEQSGLKILVNQTLNADIENEILLDFDAGASVIQTVVTATSGNIKGSISPVGVAMVSATSASGIVYTSSVNTAGQFQISGLPPGSYTFTVTPVLPLLPITQTNVVVTAGASTNLGVITF